MVGACIFLRPVYGRTLEVGAGHPKRKQADPDAISAFLCLLPSKRVGAAAWRVTTVRTTKVKVRVQQV